MRYTGLHHLLTWGAAAVMAAAAFPAHAQGGRLSLADRVARLEQSQVEGQSTQKEIELLNRIGELQAEIQSLRGLVEQQSFEIEGLKKRARDQYIDLDSRLTRLEGGTPADGGTAVEGGTAIEGATPVDGGASAGSLTADELAASADDADPAAEAPATTGFEDPAPSVSDPERVTFEEPEVRPPVDGGSSTQGITQDEGGSVVGSIANPADERRMYESAFDALKEGRYAEAARRFQGFLNTYPNGEFAPNAHYWLGESYYVTQNYQIALDAFRRLLSQFPSSSKAPDALLKVGYCQYELRQWAEAEATLNEVVQKYPESTVARLAQGRLRALRMESRQ